MKKWLLLLAWVLASAAPLGAQTADWPSNPEYRIGLPLTQLMTGQVQLELERQEKGSKYSLVGQVFGGYVEPAFMENGVDVQGSFNRTSHWGLGFGGRYYDKAAGSRVFVQMSGFFKETSVWYVQKQWLTQMQDGLPVYRYGDAEVMDRYNGFGGEFLAGAQGFAGRVVIEAAYGLVLRRMQPVGTFHGRAFDNFDVFALQLNTFTPVFVGKIGYRL